MANNVTMIVIPHRLQEQHGPHRVLVTQEVFMDLLMETTSMLQWVNTEQLSPQRMEPRGPPVLREQLMISEESPTEIIHMWWSATLEKFLHQRMEPRGPPGLREQQSISMEYPTEMVPL